MTPHRLFPLEVSDIGDVHTALCEDEESKLWHRRFGHLSYGSLQLMAQKKLVDGLPSVALGGLCEGWAIGKQARHCFPTGQSMRAKAPLELVHGDLVGPMQTISLGGNTYVFLLTDDFSRYSWVFFHATKVRSTGKVQNFQTTARKPTWSSFEDFLNR